MGTRRGVSPFVMQRGFDMASSNFLVVILSLPIDGCSPGNLLGGSEPSSTGSSIRTSSNSFRLPFFLSIMVLAKLFRALLDWFEHQDQLEFISSSLLLVYNGTGEALQSPPRLVRASGPARIHFVFPSSCL